MGHNPALPLYAKGMVIVRLQARGARISFSRMASLHARANPRKKVTIDWHLFIDYKGKLC